MEMEASCSSSTTSIDATSEEERLWRECLKNCFGRSAARKAAQLHDDITCLSLGLKPALLLDYIRPDSTALQRFLRTLRRHNVALPELTILVLNEDIFLIHLPTLQQSYNRSVEFINITRTDEISVLTRDQSLAVRLQIREWVNEAISTSLAEGPYPVITDLRVCPGRGAGFSLCSVYGWLVGYPVVYWTSEDCQLHHTTSISSMECVPAALQELSVWTVVITNKLVSCTEQQPLSAVDQLLWRNVSTSCIDQFHHVILLQ